VLALTTVREAVREAATSERPVVPRNDWNALAGAIHRRERKRVALHWVAIAAASIVGVAILTVRTTSTAPDQSSVRNAEEAPDTAAAVLSRAVSAGRDRLSASELRTMDDLVAPIDGAIRQTRAALKHDPRDAFLLAHLAELERKRVSALTDFVDRIRSKG